MDDFEYSIQLNDRDWAEFFLAVEECNLAPASLATAEEQSLSDIEQGDGVPGSTDGPVTARVGSRPGPGTGSSAPRGVTGDACPGWKADGHLSVPELLSDEADVGSAGRILCASGEPGCPSSAPMPSVQGRQPPCPPAGTAASPAGGTAQDAACEAAAPQPQKGAGSGSPAMERPGNPAGRSEHGGDAGAAPGQGGSPAVPASPGRSARKGLGSASRLEPGPRGPPREPPLSPALEAAPKAPVSPAREEASGDRAGSERCSPAGSPEVVRPKVPAQTRKSRRQRGVSATEAAPGDKEPVGAAGQGTAVPIKAPLSSPLSSRKSKGKEKAAKPAPVRMGSEEAVESKKLVPSPGVDEGDLAASLSPKQKVKEKAAKPAPVRTGSEEAVESKKPVLSPGVDEGDAAVSIPLKQKVKDPAPKPAPVRLGSEEAAENKQPVPSPSVDEGGPAMSTPPEQKVKEPVAQPLGKVKATKQPKAGQAGGLGVRDTVIPDGASRATAPSGGACQEKPLHPKSVVAFGGHAADRAHAEPAAEVPRELGPPCFEAGTFAGTNTLDVTWPEMYDYLFCDSQEEEEGTWDSVEGGKTLEREISLPELYEYFFNEPEGKRKKAKSKDRKRKKFSSLDHTELQNEDADLDPVKDSVVISVPEVYEHFFVDGPGNRGGWRGMFSIAPTSEVKKAVGALKTLLQRHLVGRQVPAPQALVRRGSGENLPLVPLGLLGRSEAQSDLDMALALRGSPQVPLALTHKDMCLVFCAFASWAVKTSDLQAPDAWKTMFLATFGTLSAIRYFRRQVREGRPRT
ncbi:PGC-1 and ERR-induced regulator in muscle protein 1 [Pezoporus flaviventris]|uniref:PGC-1 and ERR-induced regulator in muscle protein 1 n=1 Tax=Pezoporus flaviventris TaxID=889875 RepID=UPI002AB1B44C|nr:PGC-1 and ERR-induced regulator in muscle protein 1 [Pezoporus flaviventris]